ncbi:MAG TPA: HAMP domain-containing sensor histidine kinase [Methylocella sp.]|nr:HAMP domain-containing sensor histidine kinase [Methylocella sp.]
MSLLPILIAAMAMVFATAAAASFVCLRSLRHLAKKTEEELDDELAETLGSLIVRCDWVGSVTSVSSNCGALFGVPPAELMGRGFFERVQVADRPAFLKAVSDAIVGTPPVNATLRWRASAQLKRGIYAEPAFLWLELQARRRAAFSAPGNSSGNDEAIAIIRDVTDVKRQEAELKEARSFAHEANLGKEDFLAHAGHELRTPLNAIVGFSELLGDPRLAPLDFERQCEYARIIHQSGLHLLAVVDSILSVSKIHSGALAVDLESFGVAPMIDLCCDMVKLRAKKAGVELLRAYPQNVAEIRGDKHAFAQILINLLSNAIKFTPPNGSVTIRARPEPHSLSVLVSDTGLGIATSDLIHLGDPFFQAKGVPDRKEKGTGLGLSIVRGLVGRQGGTIAVASEPNKGTSVHVRLPLDCRDPATNGRGPAKIETIARLPVHEHHDPSQQMMVQKIA